MQITIKLKGIVKIIAFFSLLALCVGYGAKKVYRYVLYRHALGENDRKQQANQVFAVKAVQADTAAGRYLVLSSFTQYHDQYSGNLLILDRKGSVLFQRPVKGIVYDFRPWDIDGRRFYSYAVNNHINDSTSPGSGSACHIVILDSAMNELKQVHLLSHLDVAGGGRQDLDLHDFILLAENHYITMASYPKTVANIPVSLVPARANKLLVPVIQEIRNDTVIMQWDASHHPGFYFSSQAGNKFGDTTVAQDYIHLNSMTIDPKDGNLVLSLLNQNQVVKINRQTGDIVWRLGGADSDFPLTADQVFLRQHHATFSDTGHTLMLLDNGTPSLRPASRLLQFRLDEQAHKITSFSAYAIPGRFISSRGSVARSGDDYIICGGIANYILVVNCRTGAVKADLRTNQCLYRVYETDNLHGLITGNNKK